MSSPEFRGTLSAYAKFAKISIQTACMRNKRGQIVMCDDYPHLVDFIKSNAVVRNVGAPRKPRNSKKIHINIWVTPEQYRRIKQVVGG